MFNLNRPSGPKEDCRAPSFWGGAVRVRLAVDHRVQLVYFFVFLLEFAIDLVDLGHELTHRPRFGESNRAPDNRDLARKLRVVG